MEREPFGFYEFFAGGGMARLGLGDQWRCLMANDICEKKARSYRKNFNEAPEFICQDVTNLRLEDLPGEPALAWASFPCQDLSLAGSQEGLNGERSGTFRPFSRLIQAMDSDGRKIPIIVLENVVGAITSNKGRDFETLLRTLVDAGYDVGPLVIDGIHFVPQSRPRLFIVAVTRERDPPTSFLRGMPDMPWHTKPLRAAHQSLPIELRRAWVWWRLPKPTDRALTLTDLIEEAPSGVEWHSPEQTRRLLGGMSDLNLQKVRDARASGKRTVGTVYKRTRPDGNGGRRWRAEARFDQISGCLRTPVGGSSRQFVLIVEGDKIRSRLLSPREAARLMGVPDSYRLPENYNEACHLMGDSLVVPAVAWLERCLLHPLAGRTRRPLEVA